jgi:SagB-type dehydrogenase family enzyme
MNLDEFLYNLHFEVEKELSNNQDINWEDKPLPYKLYKGLPTIPLSAEVPLTFENIEVASPTLRSISHFLWYTFGLAQFSQLAMEGDFTEDIKDMFQTYRRFVPSGGGLYPSELYVYLKIDDVPHGIYHYDVAHHRLVLVREGNVDSYISEALGNRCEMEKSFGTIFVSTMFWKNFFKYKNFSYRLQGLDAGALIGQLLEVAKQYRFESSVYFQFLDKAVNHLLGLSEQEESVYAIVPLSVDPSMKWFTNENNTNHTITATQLCHTLPKIQHQHYVRSRQIEEYPMLVKANEASLFEELKILEQMEEKKLMEKGQVIPLPQTTKIHDDFAKNCRKRYSPEMDFVLQKVSQEQVSRLFQESFKSFQYRNDLDVESDNNCPRISLYSCLYNVEGIQNGSYYYDDQAHVLKRIKEGDQRGVLQSGMTLDNVNLNQTPICIHIAGDKDYMKQSLGYRGYRIQQMEVGMLVQRLLLAGLTMDLGGHPLLGYDANVCDPIYEVQTKKQTTLIQIPIGKHYERAWLKGSLHN